MKIHKTIFVMTTLVFVFGTTFATGGEPSNYEGEAYLETVNPITSWDIRNGNVITGLNWFDQLSQQYSISNLREVNLSCQISLNFYHITFNQVYTVQQVCDAFEQETDVVQAWPVMIPEWYTTPDDPSYGNQWGLVQIGAASAWDYESGNSSVIIGILDTGAEVEYDADPTNPVHPDLESNLWNNNWLYGIDLIDPSESPDDGFGHGTHVAGIAGAVTNNTTGISGLAGGGFGNDDGVTLLIVRNSDDWGNSSEEYLAESICQALNPDGDWNTDDWVDIINMSWGARRSPYDPPPNWQQAFPLFKVAVDEAANRNVILIAAAGNDDTDFTDYMGGDRKFWPYPAGYDEVIAVAATANDDDQTSYSNEGSFIDVAAPGGTGYPFDSNDILSTTPRDPFYLNTHYGVGLEYGYLSGTSMAAPYVTGLAGLILSRFPSYTPNQVRNLLSQSAEKVGSNSYDGNGWNKYLGYGRINAGYAIAPPSTPQNFTVTGNVGDPPTCSWSANIELDLAGYKLYKNEAGSGWALFRTLDKNTTSYTDNSVIIGSGGKFSDNVCYKVSAYDITNQESTQSWPRCKPLGGVSKQMADNELELIPNIYTIDPAFPNPFNPSTRISYQLPNESQVSLSIYNLQGYLIRSLVSSKQDAGYYKTFWDGLNNAGESVSSGMYLIMINASSREDNSTFKASRKVVLLR